MTNENCLQGIRCPACDNEDRFRIQVLATATVTDDGAVVEHGDMEWDATSYAECPNCHEHGELAHFMARTEAPEPPPPHANAQPIAAAPDMLSALEQAVAALNTAPRFRVPSLDSDSYRIAALCDAAIAKTKGGAQ